MCIVLSGKRCGEGLCCVGGVCVYAYTCSRRHVDGPCLIESGCAVCVSVGHAVSKVGLCMGVGVHLLCFK